MRIFISILVIATLMVSCNPSPTYNPFDDDFDIDINELLNNGWDKPMGTQCGYAMIIEPEGKFRLFYQVFDEELKYIKGTNWLNPPVVGKGFVYTIDTLTIDENEQELLINRKDFLIQIPFDTMGFNSYLIPFGFQVTESKKDSITISNNENGTSINLRIETFNYAGGLTVRGIEYYTFKNGN